MFAGVTKKVVPVILMNDPAIKDGDKPSEKKNEDGTFKTNYEAYEVEYDEDLLTLEGTPTKFLIGPIYYEKNALIKSMIAERAGLGLDILMLATKHGLKGWRDLTVDGTQVVCKLSQGAEDKIPTTVDDDSMQILSELPGGMTIELIGQAAIALSSLSDEQRKN